MLSVRFFPHLLLRIVPRFFFHTFRLFCMTFAVIVSAIIVVPSVFTHFYAIILYYCWFIVSKTQVYSPEPIGYRIKCPFKITRHTQLSTT